MNTDLFDYPLPESLIASVPAEKRDGSRLMVVNRATQTVTHTTFDKIAEHLPFPCRLLRNNAAVFKARLFGKRETGGKVECLMLTPGTEPNSFWCLLKPGKRLQPGSQFFLPEDSKGHVIDKKDTGEYLVRFENPHFASILAFADRYGEIPLPPYIERKRLEDPALRELDSVRYQTVYANPQSKVAAAAPTAGLHFTDALLQTLTEKGATAYNVTLHVGLDTFQPIKTDTLEEHQIHREFYEIAAETCQSLHTDKTTPRIAVGTTSMRAVEDYFRKQQAEPGLLSAEKNLSGFSAEADIFIYPPAQFLGIDHLLTNFHLPRSTLLCLVSAFLTPGSSEGIKWLKELYREAINNRYRFYSYGDAMLIL